MLIPCLLFVDGLRLKITFMPEWHISRWHSVSPFPGAAGRGSTRRLGNELQCQAHRGKSL